MILIHISCCTHIHSCLNFMLYYIEKNLNELYRLWLCNIIMTEKSKLSACHNFDTDQDVSQKERELRPPSPSMNCSHIFISEG